MCKGKLFSDAKNEALHFSQIKTYLSKTILYIYFLNIKLSLFMQLVDNEYIN